ncbi:MAG: DNA polymerase/3'-5' exonuclease PolX [Candidatus Omnitrophica bacterium]|nr:DNA polymerase/3'-5' exonuclease PolX [Candidatus Omnitrophota bacterium]
MDKKQVAEILEEIGTLLELKGEISFKFQAYFRAARSIDALTDEIDVYVKEGRLREIPGVGEGLAEKITELVTTGKLKYLEELKKSFPESLFQLLQIQGLGPKKVKVLYEKLKIKSVADLEKAARAGTLSNLDGFGEKTSENILKGIEHLKKHSGYSLYSNALAEAEKIITHLSKHPKTIRISIAGSLRRHKEIIRDLDILVSSKNPEAIMETFTTLDSVETVTAKGETKSSVLLKSGIQVDLRVVTDTEFPYALHHFTGSKEHNTAMRARAKQMEMKMNEYGLFKEPSDKLIPCKDEEEIFEKLDLSYIPPELRENMGEIEAGARRAVPLLIEEKDIRGVFHTHSLYSDGAATIEDMAKEAQRLGLKYIGLSDHSRSAAYAHGMEPERIKKQWKEIDEINKRLKGIRILKGSEVDILGDGSLDYDNAILAELDFVIVSVHSRFTMSETEMTKRIIKAIQNKYTTMLGHMTGRLLLGREGYHINHKEIFQAAKDYGVIIELNANPHRFDVDWRYGRDLKELEIKVSINPDAHKVDGIADYRFGVGIARKGWLEKKDVFNTMGLEQIMKFL